MTSKAKNNLCTLSQNFQIFCKCDNPSDFGSLYLYFDTGNKFVIDFDTNYTQISADNESSYFTLYMNGLEPERYYQILIKTVLGGETLILNDNYYFKVING